MASIKKLKKYLRFYFLCKKTFKKSNIFFCFPYYHLGGAEKVHIDIINCFATIHKICLITNESLNDFNKSKFLEVINLFEVQYFLKDERFKTNLYKIIASFINRSKNPVIFGCNSQFFYNLIPYLNKNVKIIDLIHAFSFEEPLAAEKYSLNHVPRITKRVVLGQKTLQDFKDLYIESNIDLSNLGKIEIIRNKVTIPDNYQEKPKNLNLKIMYVGRNSYEKRPELFFEIAKKCLEKKLNTEFIVLGDFSNYNNEIPKNVSLKGEINSKTEINNYYLESDIILITSSREGFPMVILEGMAFGVTTITTNVGEISDIINESNQNGFLIDNNDSIEIICNKFVDKIEMLLNDRELLNQYSKKSYESVKENFSEELFNQKYNDLFKNQ